MSLPKWLLLRRASQIGTLAAFAVAAHFGATQVLRGNLSSSLLFDAVPLTDPFAALQMLLAGHAVTATALTGAALVLALYALVAGRAFCSWVCPLNLVTDLAAWLNRRHKLRGVLRLPRTTRWLVLVLSLALSALLGVAAFEWISPIGVLQRMVIYGLGAGWTVVAGVFLFDLLVMERGVCGHLCPLGAFYALVGSRPALRVRFDAAACTDCMDCHKICPERQVLHPILPTGPRATWIDAGACTNCGRCVDVCEPHALQFGVRAPLLRKGPS